MDRLAFALVLLSTAPGSIFIMPLPSQATARQDIAAVYTEALATLLGDPAEHLVILLPSAARPELVQEPRRASSAPHRASAAVTQDVAARLKKRGYRGVMGVQRTVAQSEAMQIVLGELRFEPADRPAFARLTVGVIGSGGAVETLEFLLKREGDSWVTLKFEIEGTIG